MDSSTYLIVKSIELVLIHAIDLIDGSQIDQSRELLTQLIESMNASLCRSETLLSVE